VKHQATRLAAAALAVAAITCIPSVPAVTAAAGTAAGRVCTETFIPMSDGVRLHAWVSRQAPDQPRPVLFMMDSYSRSGQGNGTTGSADDSCPQALPDDYVPQWLSASVISQFTLVQVAYRGTGLSEGLFDMSGPRTQQDVQASVDWAASQPWSDGKVILTGESGAGFAAFFGLRNPHVTAALIYTSCADMYRCFYRGGEYNSLADVYLGTTQNDYLQLLPKRIQLGTDANPDPASQQAALAGALTQAKADTVNDAWWQQRSALAGLRDVKIPVMYTTDLYDIVQPYDAFLLTPGARLVLGMGHQSAGTVSAGGDRYEQLIRTPVDRFLAHYGLGVSNGAQSDPRVTAVTNTGSVGQFQSGQLLVRGASSWPLPGTAWTRLYLGPGKSGSAVSLNDGTLSAGPPPASGGSDTAPLLSGAHEDLRTSLLLGVAQTDLRAEETGGLTYTTPPLTHDLEISGPITLTLYAAATAPDFNWSVRLADVWPGGQSQWITDGYLRASLRQVDPARSLYDTHGDMIRPWLTYDSPQPVPVGQPVEYQLSAIDTSNVFRAGHRLRLDILPISDGEPAPAGGAGLVTVLRDGARPSSLMLPVIPGQCQHAAPLTTATPAVSCAASYQQAAGSPGAPAPGARK
jgi:putative CocE/NonD family hydrolase